MDTGQPDKCGIEEIADLISSLPKVCSSEDVAKLTEDAKGIYAEQLDDEILAAVALRLPNVQYIACRGNNNVTDEGLCALKYLSQLQWLDLEWSKISDAGLTTIAAMSTLKYLDIGFTQVTTTGTESLKLARPDLFLLSDRK